MSGSRPTPVANFWICSRPNPLPGSTQAGSMRLLPNADDVPVAGDDRRYYICKRPAEGAKPGKTRRGHYFFCRTPEGHDSYVDNYRWRIVRSVPQCGSRMAMVGKMDRLSPSPRYRGRSGGHRPGIAPGGTAFGGERQLDCRLCPLLSGAADQPGYGIWKRSRNSVGAVLKLVGGIRHR